MFERKIYEQRRSVLAARLDGGMVLLPGNGESPMNYADNMYPFRQDSTFLYYLGLDQPQLAAIIDADNGTTTLFGDELTLDEIVWMGDLPTVAARAERVGVTQVRPRSTLAQTVAAARSARREIRFLPPYRSDSVLLLANLLGLSPAHVAENASLELIRAIVEQRSRKGDEEIAEIEKAVAISVAMHEAAIRLVRPGSTERAVAAEVGRIALESGGRIAFPVIATINGQTLHNHNHPNRLAEGDLFLLDSGAETSLGYAGDLTSTFPVGADFDQRQKQIHDIVMRAYHAAVATVAPRVPNRSVHFAAARAVFEGMKELGIMRGDTEEALAAGAHAIVFPHGVGHMMGLDVHDMESLGEDHVGYDREQRSTQFGLKSLRLARALEPGFAITIEPGIYFIPQLIDAWRSHSHCADYIDYDELNRWRDFGGIRNEEDYLVTSDGARRLGPRKPQEMSDFRAIRGSSLPHAT
jgi:Xaa-Pro aminopeptidase